MVKGSRHTAAARRRMSESARRANARAHDFPHKEALATNLLRTDPLMTTKELAAALGVSMPTAARYRRLVEARNERG
jgi:hypothetical protein